MTDGKVNRPSEPTLIDIDKVIYDRNPKLLKKIPRFVVRYLKKIVHQDEINEFLKLHYQKVGLDFVREALNYFDLNTTVVGLDNIGDGKYIFAANHPLGGLDGIILMKTIGEKHKNIKFVSNDFLMNMVNLQPLFAPVNKLGKQSVSYAKIMEEMFESEVQVGFFPAGLCSRKVNGEIIDLEWKKSFIQKAVAYERDVIPVFFEGRNSRFFYNLAKLRAFFKIKFNIEMMYLVNEMFKQKGKNMRLVIGKPIPYQVFDKSKRPLEWAKQVKQHVYKLDKDPHLEFKNI